MRSLYYRESPEGVVDISITIGPRRREFFCKTNDAIYEVKTCGTVSMPVDNVVIDEEKRSSEFQIVVSSDPRQREPPADAEQRRP